MKNFKFYFVVWAIFLVIFNVIVFVIPAEIIGVSRFDDSFWIGYSFITVAFLCQLACAFIAFKEENIKKTFYNISVIWVVNSGIIVTMIIGTVCMAIPKFPVWLGLLLCFMVFAFSAISVAKASFAAESVSEIDDKIKVQTFFIKSLTIDAGSLISQTKSEAVKAECKKVYEAVRYSDPMSNDALSSVEGQITIRFAELSEAVKADDIEKATALANEVVILLGDRNKKCKLLK